MKIILPKTLCSVHKKYGPFFFLAGPVRGGNDWQADCCREIESQLNNQFQVALPCRWEDNHLLMMCRLRGDEHHFERQLTWERHYLEIAATTGCLIFWLPCENKQKPREEGPFAQDTYGELGEWRGRLITNPYLRIVIGAEKNFPGLSQIQRNFNLATKSDFPIYPTLEETVFNAIKKAG